MPNSILIVDDDASIREVLGEALRAQGYLVQAVGSCTGALALLEESRPSLLLLDLMMPVLGGWQFLEILKGSDRLSRIPVVVITAADKVPPGDYDIVRKPLDLDAVLSIVKQRCAS